MAKTFEAPPEILAGAAAAVPVAWLDGEGAELYVDYLSRRLSEPRRFVEEAERARG